MQVVWYRPGDPHEVNAKPVGKVAMRRTLCILRQVAPEDWAKRQGEWLKSEPSVDASGLMRKTADIVGTSNIDEADARMQRHFDCELF